MKIFVDGDLAVFPAAASAEKRIYVAKDTTGKVVAELEGAKAYGAWLQEIEIFGCDTRFGFRGSVGELKRELVIQPKPFKEATKCFERTIEKWLAKCPEGDVTVYLAPLSGSPNFRHDVSLRKPYKGNRQGADKPYHLQALREWALKLPYTKKATGGLETDDLVCGFAYRNGKNGLVVQNEKDVLQMFNSWVYLPDKHDSPIWSDPNTVGHIASDSNDLAGLGALFTLAQAIVGDSADFYSGIDGAGLRVAQKTLSQFNNLPMSCLPDAVREVCKLYEQKYGGKYHYIDKNGEPKVASWLDFYIESVRLAYMLKHRNDYPHIFINPAKEYWGERNIRK